MVEATLVQDALVTHAPKVPDAPVYNATPIQDMETRWWKRNQKILGLVLVLIVGLAVMAALLASKNGGNSNSGEQILGGQNTSSESPVLFHRQIMKVPVFQKQMQQ